MSTLTAQITGVNLWHGMSRSRAALSVPRHVGGEGRGKGRLCRFNPCTSSLISELLQLRCQMETLGNLCA